MIKEWIENWKSRERGFKELQESDLMNRKLNERKLSHNERVLNKLMEEDRQEQIKHNLKLMNMKRRFEDKKRIRDSMSFNSNLFKDDVIFTQENMFKNG